MPPAPKCTWPHIAPSFINDPDPYVLLAGLWSRLVSSMPYLKGDSPSLLETNVPAITQAYITTRWGAAVPNGQCVG